MMSIALHYSVKELDHLLTNCTDPLLATQWMNRLLDSFHSYDNRYQSIHFYRWIDHLRPLIHPFLTDDIGNTVFHHAVCTGEIHLASFLYSDPSLMNLPNSYGKTPLHSLLSEQDVDEYQLVSWMLVCGADPALQDHYGRTAYHEAVSKPQSLRRLLDHGTDGLSVVDSCGYTPLHLLFLYPDRYEHILEVTQLLVHHGVSPLIRDDQGQTAMDLIRQELARMLPTVRTPRKKIQLESCLSYLGHSDSLLSI